MRCNIFIWGIERIYYGSSGLTKFVQTPKLWDLVYQNEQVKIHKAH